MDYALPGNLVDYTISIGNTGGPVDDGTLNFIDALPDNVTLFTGDLDGSGNPVIFTDNSTPAAGVTCCAAVHIEYSDSTSVPPVFGYVPTSNYDSNITFLRLSPAGAVRDSSVNPVDLDFTFRARIN